MPLITLTTDFGTRDGYVGALKGVILSGCPAATVVDIAHDLPACDVLAGALALRGACPCFGPGTIHIAVVDPGVGSDRRLLAVEIGSHIYLAPDNGLLTLVAATAPAGLCVHITNTTLWKTPVSRTFHGRDILAPVAAALANGATLSELGPPAEDIVELDLPAPQREPAAIVGRVVAIDRFGNLITNVPGDWLNGVTDFELRLGPLRIDGLSQAYSDVAHGEGLAIIASHGYLELAARAESLADRLGASPGTGFRITLPAV